MYQDIWVGIIIAVIAGLVLYIFNNYSTVKLRPKVEFDLPDIENTFSIIFEMKLVGTKPIRVRDWGAITKDGYVQYFKHTNRVPVTLKETFRETHPKIQRPQIMEFNPQISCKDLKYAFIMIDNGKQIRKKLKFKKSR